MKKYIILGSIVIFLVAVAVAIKVVDFGRLTISLIEKSTHVDISYARMQGSVFRGFRFYDYKVKISETDSIIGNFAEFNYRFSSVRFGLPNLFEINLLEPRVYIRPGTAGALPGTRKSFKLPIPYLGLRIILKNGEIAYEAKKLYLIRKISGLVFLDFVASRLYINTMNLSFTSPDLPVPVTSVNTSLIISDLALTVKSCFARGSGFVLDGSGEYRFLDNSWSLNLRKADLDLKTLNIYRGRIEGKGSVAFARGHIQPRLQGTGSGIGPVDRFQFETNVLGDTVLVNLFNGELSGGEFSAECKFADFREPLLIANFEKVDLAPFLKVKTPVRVDGRLRYAVGKFAAFLNLSVADRPPVDSIYAFGQAEPNFLSLDSFYIRAGEKVLDLQGSVLPRCSLDVVFNKFDLEKYVPDLPVKGRLSGACGVRGDLKKLADLAFDFRLDVPEVMMFGIQGKDVNCNVRGFKYAEGPGFLKLKAADLSYKKFRLDSASVEIQDHRFDVRGYRLTDNLLVAGKVEKDFTGTIERLVLSINKVVTRNIQTVDFDLPKRRLGDFALNFMGGVVKGTIQPLRLELRGIKLSEIGRFLRYRDTLRGEFDADYDGRLVRLDARHVDFMDLEKGTVLASGQIRDRGIVLDSLVIKDARDQRLRADGFLDLKESDINLKVSNFGVWPLIFLRGLMDQPRGIINGAAKFTGNFENFRLNGDARVEDFSFGIKVITARFDSVRGQIKLNGDRIQFQELRGRMYSTGYNKQGSGAEIAGGGTVKLEPRFKAKNLTFDFNFKDAPIQYLPFVYGRGTGNFSINLKNEITYYSGNVSVKEGVVPIDFGTKLPSAEPNKKADDRWRMNLKVSADRNVWLRNREADIEFGGDLYIIKEQGPLYLAGTLQTRRGDFYWFSHTLKVTAGQITFVPEEVIDPQLDFTAELNTHERSRKAENKEITITLRASGTLSEPIFEFFSDPPDYSEQDILTYLNLNITWEEMESIKQGKYVGEVLPKSLLAWLESDVSRRIRKYTGMDVIRIDAPFFEAGQKTKLTVGKYISRNLFITYTYDFTTFSNQFNVEYFINDKNEIMVKREEVGDYSLEYQYRIRF